MNELEATHSAQIAALQKALIALIGLLNRSKTISPNQAQHIAASLAAAEPNFFSNSKSALDIKPSQP